MTDLYLKFESAEQADPLLYDTTELHVDEQGMVAVPDLEGNYPEGTTVKLEKRSKFQNLDVIGEIYKPTGETTTQTFGETEMQVPVMQKLDGWHVNIRLVGEDATSLETYKINPAQPVRVWA